MLDIIRKHVFHISGETILTGLDPESGHYIAFQNEAPEIRGEGRTRLEAIADLGEKSDQEREREEIDMQAMTFDHMRDLRKHG
ncbi:hypothetical protein [Bradyrhizobium sp. Ai1a-2]|uniref:hypothetical protein n=1 Tax=Bradyrhizobium sp. Ai1a-2 TaxID=196490 RepID=UPI000410F71D|nr:hypothetical protein [Bradyrhizobium sp. Ai1a-2]